MTTRSKTKAQKHFKDDGHIDRISKLPKNVIDLIMGFLPVRDAARTSVLSTKWRYAWTDQLSLVLDDEFWKEVKDHRLSRKLTIDFAGIVNSILLRHIGNIEKFVVDISDISSRRHCDINQWLSLLCRRSLKVLSLKNSASNPFITPLYITPSCIFYAPELTSLSISRCIIKIKETFTVFNRLRNLTLQNLTLDSSVLKAPVLTSLILDHCCGIRGFSISAPKLLSLTLEYNDDLNLIPYLICTNITSASISVNENILGSKDIKCVNLLVILRCWPRMVHFELNGSALEVNSHIWLSMYFFQKIHKSCSCVNVFFSFLVKYLATGIVPESLSFVLALTSFMPIRFKKNQIFWVLRFLQKSPFLQIFEFSLDKGSLSRVWEYLGEPNIMNERMEQLHTVKVRHFPEPDVAIGLLKFLLYCSPSLKKLLFGAGFNICEKARMGSHLRNCPHSSPKVEIDLGLDDEEKLYYRF